MSLVDTSTGEIVQMDEAAARELVDSIRSTGDLMWRQIVRAFQGRAWLALGYSSWDELCEHEFDGARIKLPREERREVVASLAEAGMSQYAIASATGLDRKTIRNDQRHQVEEVPPPDPDDDIVDAEIVENVGPVDHKPITGLDGKQYPKPEPKEQVDRRPALPRQIEERSFRLKKAADSLERLADDDRFTANRERIAPTLRSDLTHVIEVCQDLLDRITVQEDTQ